MLLEISADKIAALLREAQAYLPDYGLGFKIEPIDLQGPELIGTNPATGERGPKIDCSGFTRWAIYHASGGQTLIPDGSIQQHAWILQHGFQSVAPAEAHAAGGTIYIAFLSPSQSAEHIGHVLLIANGRTAESHGSAGPDSREWGSEPWMSEMSVYVLSAPA